MRPYLLSGLVALASGVLADVTYNVIGFPEGSTTAFGVEVNNKIYPLTTSDATFPLWSAKVPGVSAASGYRYVRLNNKDAVVGSESFQRSFRGNTGSSTPNEFFNRQSTYTTLPSIKQVYKDVRPRPSKAFDASQVATIHLTVDPALFKDMLDHPLDEERKAIPAQFRFVNADTIYTPSSTVQIKVSGHGTRKFKKLSFKIKFNQTKGDTFYDRPAIKLRSEVFDPTMIRERLYIDLLNAAGVPSYQGAYVRFYVNGKPHGFYLMVEDIDAPYLQTTIHGGSIRDSKSLGSLYKMSSHVIGQEATLLYQGARTADYNPLVYENKILGQNPKEEPMQQLIAFLKELQDWNPATTGGTGYWSSRLDLDGFLRSMVLEYLTGAWDNYWWKGNNYFMYYNPQTRRWQFLPTDFDSTFSDGNRPDVNVGYKTFARSRLARQGKDHPLVTKLVYKNKEINAKFEDALRAITLGVFNNKALDSRIDAYAKQIEHDVAWDYGISRSQQPGKDAGWTLADFHNSINGPVKTVAIGIKPWISGRAKSLDK